MCVCVCVCVFSKHDENNFVVACTSTNWISYMMFKTIIRGKKSLYFFFKLAIIVINLLNNIYIYIFHTKLSVKSCLINNLLIST